MVPQSTIGRVASVVGRYYAMDRDRRWERTQAAYDLFVHGRAPHHSSDACSAARAAYERGETDEFIAPTLVGDKGLIRSSDSILCFNFRPDRMRQIVRALGEPGFGEAPRSSPAGADVGQGQLHVAETEKYARVTYFFNGGRERPFDGNAERRCGSLADVAPTVLALLGMRRPNSMTGRSLLRPLPEPTSMLGAAGR
jgi:2,3-bisphosphoglycerate-independent phosphoglycerate mutase